MQNPVTAIYSALTPTNIAITQAFDQTRLTTYATPAPFTQILGLGVESADLEDNIVPGITTSFSATVPDTSAAGAHFAMVQLIDSCIQTTSAGVTATVGFADSKLDGAPGDTQPFYPYPSAEVAGNEAYRAIDAPSSALQYESAPYSTEYRQNHFVDDFEYLPSPAPSQAAFWIPVAQTTWYWNGSATEPSPTPEPFLLDYGYSGPIYDIDYNPPAFPTWSGTFIESYNNPAPGDLSSC